MVEKPQSGGQALKAVAFKEEHILLFSALSVYGFICLIFFFPETSFYPHLASAKWPRCLILTAVPFA